MQFERDDARARASVARHGIDFAVAQRVFDGPVLTRPDTRRDHGEARHVSVRRLGRAVIVAAHATRGDRRRLISARPASRRERRSCNERIQEGTESG